MDFDQICCLHASTVALKTEEAKKFLPFAFKIIDTATKKHILQLNNASRKKSRIAKALNELEKKGGAKAPEAKAEEVKAE